MDRRTLVQGGALSALSTLAAAAAAATPAPAKTATPGHSHHAHAGGKNKALIDSSAACVTTGEACQAARSWLGIHGTQECQTERVCETVAVKFGLMILMPKKVGLRTANPPRDCSTKNRRQCLNRTSHPLAAVSVGEQRSGLGLG